MASKGYSCENGNPTTFKNEIAQMHEIRVDCEAQSDLCARYHIRGYPTMYLFKNGEMASEPYRDDRTSKAWISHLENAVHEYESHLPNVSSLVLYKIFVMYLRFSMILDAKSVG